MSHANDYNYFAYRVDQENELGDRAASLAIAAIHYELAYRYALLCREHEPEHKHEVEHKRAPLSPMPPMSHGAPSPRYA